MKTVAAALTEARDAGVDRLDAYLLLAHVLKQSRAWLLANDDAQLTGSQQQLVNNLVARRTAGEPLAYLVGEKEFHGLVLQVSPEVLVPRPDTETLVDWALELLGNSNTVKPTVLDMGTGSGAIALALKHGSPQSCVTALDVSAAALAIAHDNAVRLRLDIQLVHSDWWQVVSKQRFNMIVSNPPYIASDDAHLAALRHEPMLALTPGGDGLGALRHIIVGAPQHLQPQGWLLLEHGHDQAQAVAALLRDQHFDSVTTRHDLAGNARCTGGRLS